MGTYPMLVAYAGIVLLAVVLIIVNVRSGVREYQFHRYKPRLMSQMMAVGLVGSMLITLSYFVIDRAMDAALSIQDDALVHRTPLSLNKL